jgi:hypothetical protein
MTLKRVLILTVFAAAAALVVPGAAHAQVRVGIAFGGGYRPAYYSYYRPGVRVAIGLPPVAIGVGAPVYVAPPPVYYPAPVYLAPAPVYVAPQPVAAVPAPPGLPPAPVPIR